MDTWISRLHKSIRESSDAACAGRLAVSPHNAEMWEEARARAPMIAWMQQNSPNSLWDDLICRLRPAENGDRMHWLVGYMDRDALTLIMRVDKILDNLSGEERKVALENVVLRTDLIFPHCEIKQALMREVCVAEIALANPTITSSEVLRNRWVSWAFSLSLLARDAKALILNSDPTLIASVSAQLCVQDDMIDLKEDAEMGSSNAIMANKKAALLLIPAVIASSCWIHIEDACVALHGEPLAEATRVHEALLENLQSMPGLTPPNGVRNPCAWIALVRLAISEMAIEPNCHSAYLIAMESIRNGDSTGFKEALNPQAWEDTKDRVLGCLFPDGNAKK